MSTAGKIYRVHRILDHKVVEGKDNFKIRWSGYSGSHDTWEPRENLLTCSSLMDTYMENKAAANRRQSLRVRVKDKYALSSDEEDVSVLTPKKATKKTTVSKRNTRNSATPTRAPKIAAVVTKNATTSVSVKKPPVKVDYVGLSTDEETVEYSTARTTRTTRLSLSESRIKNLHGNYNSSPKTSTPTKIESRPTVETKIQSSKKLVFNSIPGVLTRRKQKEMQEVTFVAEAPPTIAQAEESTVAQADEPEESSIKCSPAKVSIVENDGPSEEEVCFPVTWREFALAAFVTGLAAVGYVCYTTDYCSY